MTLRPTVVNTSGSLYESHSLNPGEDDNVTFGNMTNQLEKI